MLFEVTFLFIFFSLSLKFVCYTKSVILFWLAKFAYFNLAAKFSDLNLLNFGVVIYTSRLEILLSTSQTFVFKALNMWYFVGHLLFLYLSPFYQYYTDTI